MGVRKSRVKILLGIATFITIYGIYYHFYASEEKPLQTVEKDKVETEIKPPPKDSEKHLSDDVQLELNKDAPFSSDVKDMREYVLQQNYQQTIKNEGKFGQHISGNPIFLVQIHDRTKFFRELINSLRNVNGIEKITLVVSADKLVKENEDIIDEVDFCRVIKIYFPYSMQLYPNTFPGEDPNDCPRDLPKASAIQRKCNNAEFPDQYGHYREIKYVQVKHHWFWKLHMVFSGIRAFQGGNSPVLLLEEDYYVTPDILKCMNLAIALKDEKCPKCQTISLGNYQEPSETGYINHVEFKAWVSSTHNMGMVITKSFYDSIVTKTDAFCEYDDYNWDWSLQASIEGIFTIAFKASRIFHIGTCGMHSNDKSCVAKDEAAKAERKIKNLQLFPDSLHVALDSAAVAPKPRPNGGWGDIRDHHLCKDYRKLCKAAMGS